MTVSKLVHIHPRRSKSNYLPRQLMMTGNEESECTSVAAIFELGSQVSPKVAAKMSSVAFDGTIFYSLGVWMVPKA